MPVVVVHGVNTRKGAEYDAWMQAITVHCASKLSGLKLFGKTIADTAPHFCYWGDLGVRFAWDYASLPASKREHFGSISVVDDLVAREGLSSLSKIFNRPTGDAITILSELLATAPDIDQGGDIASVLAILDARRSSQDSEDLLETLADSKSDASTIAVLHRLTEIPSVGEKFGGHASEGVRKLATLSAKIAQSAGAALSARVTEKYRATVHKRGAAFVGDLAKYASERNRDCSSPIQQAVLSAIREAASAAPTEPLLLIGHSLGGLILMDILEVETLSTCPIAFVTVGSQVSYFEEMKLLLGSSPGIPGARARKAHPPAQILRWVNVYDPVDFFSYVCGEVFDSVVDVEWESKTSLLSAHGAYFFNPSFYAQLRTKLEDGPDEHLANNGRERSQ